MFTVLFFQLFCIFGISYNKMLEGKKGSIIEFALLYGKNQWGGEKTG